MKSRAAITDAGPVRPGGSGSMTSAEIIDLVRAKRREADRLEVEILELAIEWAHAHLEEPGDDTWHAPKGDGFDDGGPGMEADPAESEWFGLPRLRWDAAASFAAANGMSTAAGRAMLRDGLILDHRLPRVWSETRGGKVPAWRARRIAAAVVAAPADVAAYVDTEVAPRAGLIGAVALDRVLDEAMLRLHAEERELAQLEALDHRHVTLFERSINDTGIGDLQIRADWIDLTDFDATVGDVAAALKRDGDTDSLDSRRARAIGILADPASALALLCGEQAPKPRRQISLVVHLSEPSLLGLDPVCFDDQQRAILDQVVRAWCGRDDKHLTIRPVIDRNDEIVVDSYAPSDTLAEQVRTLLPTCVFPHCRRQARRCDCDHVVPHGEGASTCTCNLAPLCRHHHRLKTHAGWSYSRLDPTTFRWRDPHGQLFLRTRDGTRDITPLRPRELIRR